MHSENSHGSDCNLLICFIVWKLRHGYGRWQAIIDDKDLKIQDVICKELNLSVITLPVPGVPQGQAPQISAPELNQAHSLEPGVSQTQTAPNISNTDMAVNTANGNDNGAGTVPGTSDSASHPQYDSGILYHFREMQRKQVEFVKKRVLLLEKGLNAEYQKEYFVSFWPTIVHSSYYFLSLNMAPWKFQGKKIQIL